MSNGVFKSINKDAELEIQGLNVGNPESQSKRPLVVKRETVVKDPSKWNGVRQMHGEDHFIQAQGAGMPSGSAFTKSQVEKRLARLPVRFQGSDF